MNERRYGVLIASSKFEQEPSLPPLRCPENDVDGLNAVISSNAFGDFDPADVFVVKNQPSHEVMRRLNQTLKRAGKDDLVLIYYSGHGKQDLTGRLHLATSDTMIESLESTSIPVDRIRNFVEVSACNKVILILDCCYSGAAGDAFFRGAAGDQLQYAAGGRGTFILTASTKLQLAQEKEGDLYGLLTKHIIIGIREGKADRDRDGVITMDELYSYVHDKVLEESAQEPEKYSLQVRGELIIARTRLNRPPAVDTKAVELNIDSTYRLHSVLPGHRKATLSLAFSPRGRSLACATGEGPILIWDVHSSAIKQTLDAHLGAVWGVAFAPDGRALVSAGHDKAMRIWTFPEAVLGHMLDGGDRCILALAAHPNESMFAAAGYEGKVRLLALKKGEVELIGSKIQQVIHALRFSPDGQLLAAAGTAKNIQLWDSVTGELKQVLRWHTNTVFTLSFSNDGRFLASAGRDGRIKLWDALGSWAPGPTLRAHNHSVLAVAFHPTSLLLASGGGDNTIRFWRAEDGKLLQTLDSGHGTVHCLSFSPDGEVLASGGSDQVVRLWRVTSAARSTYSPWAGSV